MGDKDLPQLTSTPPERATPASIGELLSTVRQHLEVTEAQQDSIEQMVGQMTGMRKEIGTSFRSIETRFDDISQKLSSFTDAITGLRKSVDQFSHLHIAARDLDKKRVDQLNKRVDANEYQMGKLAGDLEASNTELSRRIAALTTNGSHRGPA